jgi:hypothetical protein
VFENELVELDASAATLTAAEANEHALILAETRRLHIAAHWADLHAGDAIAQSRIPGTEHPDDLAAEPVELADDQPDSTKPADQTTDTDPADFEPSSDPASSDEARHRSLQIMPTPFNPDRARPCAIVYVHLSEAALRAGSGVARVEDVGPVLLGRLHMLLGDRCSISLKPVIDLPAGHIPLDCYEVPGESAGTFAAALSG